MDITTQHLEVLTTEDHDVFTEGITAMKDQGLLDSLLPAQLSMLANGTNIVIKQTLVRMALSAVLGERCRAARSQSPELAQYVGVPTSVDQPASVEDLKKIVDCLDQFDRSTADFEKNNQAEQERATAMDGMTDRIGSMMSDFDEASLELVTNPVPLTADSKYRSGLRKVLKKLEGRLAFMRMNAALMDEQRLNIVNDNPEIIAQMTGQDVALLLTPFTEDCDDHYRHKLIEAIESVKKLKGFNDEIAKIEKIRIDLLAKYPIGTKVMPHGKNWYAISREASLSIEHFMEKHSISMDKAIESLRNLLGKIEEILEEQESELAEKMKPVTEKHALLVERFGVEAFVPTGQFKKDLYAKGPLAMVSRAMINCDSFDEAVAGLAADLDNLFEIMQRQEEDIDASSATASSGPARKRVDPSRRAAQVARSQAGPKKGVNAQPPKHGAKK